PRLRGNCTCGCCPTRTGCSRTISPQSTRVPTRQPIGPLRRTSIWWPRRASLRGRGCASPLVHRSSTEYTPGEWKFLQPVYEDAVCGSHGHASLEGDGVGQLVNQTPQPVRTARRHSLPRPASSSPAGPKDRLSIPISYLSSPHRKSRTQKSPLWPAGFSLIYSSTRVSYAGTGTPTLTTGMAAPEKN